MIHRCCRWPLLLMLLCATSLNSGCGVANDDDLDKPKTSETKSDSPDKTIASAASTTTDKASAKTSSDGKPPAKSAAKSDDAELKPLEPYDPPPLAKLDAEAKWEAQPVSDAFELLRAKQAKETPSVTVAEALNLKNDSVAANANILSALGRLPKNDDEVDWDATFNRHMRSDIRSTNPVMFSLAVDAEVNQLTAFNVFTFDWNLIPFAAKEHVVSWESSADRMLDKVVLRKDLVWSDGKPITAHDVAFSFQIIMDPRVPVPAVRTGTDQLRWVHAYDDQTSCSSTRKRWRRTSGTSFSP